MSDETFDDFLAGEGLLEECEAQAIKEMIDEPSVATANADSQATLPVMASETNPFKRSDQAPSPLGILRGRG